MKRESEEVSLPIGGYFELETPRGELPCEVVRNLTENLVCIPIDQRCSDSDIGRIVELVVG